MGTWNPGPGATAGDDVFDASSGGEAANGGDGNDTLNGGAGADSLIGGDGDDSLSGGGGEDTLDGGLGRDTLIGGEGIFIGREGDDVFVRQANANAYIWGGDGFDIVDYSGFGEAVYAHLGIAPNDGFDTFSEVEKIIGSDFDDYLIAGGADAHFIGGGGDDALSGDDGDDSLEGGDGDDRLEGRDGSDTLIGGAGDDFYSLTQIGDQNDLIIENVDEGNDTIAIYRDTYFDLPSYSLETLVNVENLIATGGYSGAFTGTGNGLANLLRGSFGADTLYGLEGDDTLNGDSGVDSLIGGDGDDTYIVENANDVIVEDLLGGNDTVHTNSSYSIASLANVENITLTWTYNSSATGNDQDNILTGNSGQNTLDGGNGGDTLDGGAGADALIGGDGDDVYIVDNAGDVVTEISSANGDDEVRSSVTFTLGAHLERLVLTGVASINGVGNGLNNSIEGNAGNNLLNGGAGADTLTGGGGNDAYYVDNSGDVIVEAASGGTDSVFSSVAWVLGANLENLTLTGSAAISGVGNALNNSLTGNAGANLLDGGAGADTMAGGGGNDIYFADNAGDVIVESTGGGADVVRASVTHTLSANVENLLMLGSASIWGSGNDLANVIIGNSGANRISTGAGQDFLDGGLGADTMIGGAGNDVYYIDQAGDVVQEDVNAGIDTVRSSISHVLGANFENMLLVGAANSAGGGNGLNNLILGGVGNNKIWAGAGSDSLSGGDGNDTIHGGAGLDFLTGGAGADAFVFDTAPVASQADRISDFSVTDDTIWLENAVFSQLGSNGVLNAAFFRVGAAAADSNDYIIYNSASGALYYDNNGNAAGGSTLIAMIGTNKALTSADFLVI